MKHFFFEEISHCRWKKKNVYVLLYTCLNNKQHPIYYLSVIIVIETRRKPRASNYISNDSAIDGGTCISEVIAKRPLRRWANTKV